MKVRLLAWLIYRGYAILQILGLVAVCVGVSFLLGWPVGLIVGGVVLVGLGVLMERSNARTAP